MGSGDWDGRGSRGGFMAAGFISFLILNSSGGGRGCFGWRTRRAAAAGMWGSVRSWAFKYGSGRGTTDGLESSELSPWKPRQSEDLNLVVGDFKD